LPKQLNNGAITAALQRAFGFKGRYIPMLDEVIVPVYIIADPSPAQQTRLCVMQSEASQDATTSIFPAVQLFNPVGSGVLCNVTNVITIANIKTDINVSYTDTPSPALVAPSEFRDRRFSGNPACQVRRDQVATGLLGTLVTTFQVDGTLTQQGSWEADTSDPRQPLTVLGPGQGVLVQTATAPAVDDDGIRVSFQWLEIPLTEVNPLGGIP